MDCRNLLELVGDSLFFALFELQQHVFLGGEMEEERAVGNPGCRDDRADIGLGHTRTFELRDRRTQEALSGL